ncbi:MAG: Phosphoribosylamine--glycine ligase [Calditrichaeota bacterium]|nr:Phosphoribosylamine--glycine ligase [Calditrichota bacterium]
MKALIIGSGGREHALAWKVRKSPHVSWVGCAPGNGGTTSVAENVELDFRDPENVARYAVDNDIALTVIGPEAPLAEGVVDAFSGHDNLVFGPTQDAARLESSKRFAKEVMMSAGVPTSGYRSFSNPDEAMRYVQRQQRPVVVKANGLAAGKGVFVCEGRDEAEHAVRRIMVDRAYGAAGDEVVIEDCLRGTEASILAVCDGSDHIILAPSRDHKRIGEGDTGPNTGGMGAIAPNPAVDDELVQYCSEHIIAPVLREMSADGTPYRGVLYAGLMLTDDGPKVLEFNVRYGDPEIQAVVPLLKVDLVDLMLLAINGKLGEFNDQVGLNSHEWRRISSDAHAACVVLASSGYPGSYNKGKEITDVPEEREDLVVFHAGTKHADGKLVTSGGRVLNVTATGASMKHALETAYAAADGIQFDGKTFRRDIGGYAGYPPRGD